MKKCASLLAMVLVFTVPLPAAVEGDWQGEVKITCTDGHASIINGGPRAIAVDSNNVHVVWKAPAITDMHRYTYFSIESPPSAPDTGITFAEGYGGAYAQAPMVASWGGNVHLDWEYYGAHFREYDGSTWGNIIHHGRGVSPYSFYDGRYPSIADDNSGNTHCIFSVRATLSSHDRYILYYQRRNAGVDSFTTAVEIFHTGRDDDAIRGNSIYVTDDGTIHISTTYEYGSYDRLLYAYSTNNGASWNKYVITDPPAYTGHSSIFCDNDGIPYIAFMSTSSPRQIYITTFQSGALTTPVNVSQSSIDCWYPTICCDTFNNIWVAYYHLESGYQEVFYNVLDAETGSWIGPQTITEPDSSHSYIPHITPDPYGNVHVCWLDRRDNETNQVYYNWFQAITPRDAGVVCIDAPVDTVWSARTYTPQATVENFREKPVTFDVVCEFDSSGTLVYTDTATVTALQYGETEQVTFTDWTSGEVDGIDYTMTVRTLIPDDVDTTNDVMSKNVYAMWMPPDVGTISLDFPGDSAYLGTTYAPRATVANFNEYPALSFEVVCEFSSVEVTMYSDTVTVTNLDSMASTQVTFADWTPTADLPYRMTVFTICEDDRNPSNDEKSKVILVLPPDRDVAAIAIDAPPEEVAAGSSHIPKATFKNMKSTPATFEVMCEFDSAGVVVYADTVLISDLAGADSRQISFAGWSAAMSEGVSYTMLVLASTEGDMNPANNMLTKSVVTVPSVHDVAPLTITSPPDQILAGQAYIPAAEVKNLGEDPETFDVLCEFDSAGVIIYSDIVTVSSLDGGQSTVVEFLPWTSGVIGEFTYTMSVLTLLSSDLNPANDLISKQVTTAEALADLDIQDYAGNLSANTMELIGVENSIVVGSYVLVNPDSWQKNVDLYDGPGNVDLNITYSWTDLSTYDGQYSIAAADINPDISMVGFIQLGDAAKNILQVYIPDKTKTDVFTGSIAATGTGDGGAFDTDGFTLKVTVVDGKDKSKPSSFGGEPMAEGNMLYWSNFGFGETGFNLYRAQPGSDEFRKLNDEAMNLTTYTDHDVEVNTDYRYKLGLVMNGGSEFLLGPLSLGSSDEIGSIILYQSWPNPWSDETEISYFLPSGVNSASLKIYDITGNLVRTLAEGVHETGHHSVIWDGTDIEGVEVSSGVYFYRLNTENQVRTGKMLLLK